LVVTNCARSAPSVSKMARTYFKTGYNALN
jgi:hypothetical protein